MHNFLQINIPKLAIVFFSRTTTMNRLVIKPARWYSTYICCERLLVHFLKLGHDWMFAVFALITAPDCVQLNATSSEIFRILRLAKNSLICRHFQLGSVGRNRKPDHIASGVVIMLKTEPNWRVGVSCSQLCSVVSSFKPVGRCDRGLTRVFGILDICDRHRSLTLWISYFMSVLTLSVSYFLLVLTLWLSYLRWFLFVMLMEHLSTWRSRLSRSVPPVTCSIPYPVSEDPRRTISTELEEGMGDMYVRAFTFMKHSHKI